MTKSRFFRDNILYKKISIYYIHRHLYCGYHGYRFGGGPGGDRDACRERPEPDAVGAGDSAGRGGSVHQDTRRLRLLDTLEPTPTLVHISCVYTSTDLARAKDIPGYFSSG